MKGYLLFLATLGLSEASGAASQPVVEYNLRVSSLLPETVPAQVMPMVDTLLGFVAQLPPPGVRKTIFAWDKNREPFKNRELTLWLTTSQDPEIEEIALDVGGLARNTDGFTVTTFDPDTGLQQIALCLFYDRIFLDDTGNERSDAAARLIVLLAHEIYGNIQHFLHHSLPDTLTFEDRKEREINAFMTSLGFLQNLKVNPAFYELPVKIRTDLERLEALERESLTYWRNAETPQPDCSRAFRDPYRFFGERGFRSRD